ncbi:MAG: sensor histidine kinase [Acetanaerobacterium sp.]
MLVINNLKTGIKARIFFPFVFLSAILLVTISLILYGFLYREMKRETTQNLLYSLNEVSMRLGLILEDTKNISRSIYYNDDVQIALLESRNEEYPSLTSVSEFINSAIVYRNYIDSVVITDNTRSLYSTNTSTANISRMEDLQKKWWWDQYDLEQLSYCWIPQARLTEQSSFDNSLMLGRKIYSKSDFVTDLGTLLIFLDSQNIQDFFGQITKDTSMNIWFLNESGQQMLRNSSEHNYDNIAAKVMSENASLNDSYIAKYNGEQYVVGRINFPAEDDWSIMAVVPFSEVNQNVSRVRIYITLVLVISIIVTFISFFSVASSLSGPINYLAKIMDAYRSENTNNKQFENDIHYRKRQDEIGRIYNSYLGLTQRIEMLIKEIYIKNIEKKEAELVALESQIKPHFLYNTLDSINWMALSCGQDRISEMVTALSDTFRLSLRKSKSSYTRLLDEFNHVRSYLIIQKYRYGERLTCTFDMPTDLENQQVLFFLLQPLVENALEHGIDKIEGEGNISIKAYRKDTQHLVIEVINDGTVDIEKINAILHGEKMSSYPPVNSEGGYGIYNINSRIQLMHGKEFGLSYSNLESGKVCCQVLLPLLMKDQIKESM